MDYALPGTTGKITPTISSRDSHLCSTFNCGSAVIEYGHAINPPEIVRSIPWRLCSNQPSGDSACRLWPLVATRNKHTALGHTLDSNSSSEELLKLASISSQRRLRSPPLESTVYTRRREEPRRCRPRRGTVLIITLHQYAASRSLAFYSTSSTSAA